jgi:TRAP-type mannitol/chloroaromatic compound transport system permease small subunit
LRVLLAISRRIDALTEKFGTLSEWIVVLVIIVGFYNVVVRYTGRFTGLQLSSNLYLELQSQLFSLIFLLGFGYILKHGVNVRVDFLYTNWSVKTKAWVDLLGTLCFLVPFCLMGIYVTWRPVLTAWGLQPDGTWGAWEMSSDANGLPQAPIKTMIIVAFVLLLLQSFSQTIKYLAIINGYTEVIDVIRADTSETVKQ